MKYIFFILSIFLIGSCTNPVGDKQSTLGSVDEIGNTSFVNKNFQGNLIQYSKNLNPCEMLTQDALANLYQVGTDKIQVIGGNNSFQTCTYRVLLGEEFNFLTGSMLILPDPSGDAMDSWAEQWSIQKAASKSSEYLPNMGKAALWKGGNRTLKIKFEGYTLEIMAPGAPFNEEEKKKNRDYKSIAVDMAKVAGFIK